MSEQAELIHNVRNEDVFILEKEGGHRVHKGI